MPSLLLELKKVSNSSQAKLLSRFFKTGKGEYGEGDQFLGVKVPQCRSLVKQFSTLSLSELQSELHSPFHEVRLLILLILVHQFEQAVKENNSIVQKQLFDFYIKNAKYVNNWDLVDLTAPKLSGAYLLDKDPTLLFTLAKSSNLWERRIAVLSSFAFIRVRSFGVPLNVCTFLLSDSHDLIHKAVGWMLREIGKRDLAVEEVFLKKHYKKMPRTMLRYAIERFPKPKYRAYLNGTV